jgi:hypothetical protein
LSINSLSRLVIPLVTVLYSLSTLVVAFSISWVLLFNINFAYSGFHDVLEISKVIEQYGPLNRHRNDFELTDKTEHQRLFAAINKAVHHQGEGLSEIVYLKPDAQVIDSLLHQTEIIHLQDVANLLDQLKVLSYLVVFFWGIVLLLYRFTPLVMPGFKQQLLGIISLILVFGLLVGVAGPVDVFYALHEWVFPSGHQWFFYYEDSLMSTLMKAPDLFGVISLLLSAVAVVIFALLNWAGVAFIEKSL